jgi:hypothetical protein
MEIGSFRMNASDARFTRLAAGTVRLERERKVLGSARRASGGAASMAVPHLALGRRRWRAVWVLLVVAALIVPKLAEPAAAAVATPAFVQARSKQATSGTTNSLAFTKANTAGNLIVVAVMWSNTAAVSVADSRGNAYASPLARTTWGSGWSSQVFYAKNVAGGANTVTATFATAISSFGLLYIHEYSGIDKSTPWT